jgi:hypothetical protein
MSKSKKFTIASFGSVSSGTMRAQDLIPDFCWELRHLGHRAAELTRIESRCNRALSGKFGEDDAYFTDEMSSFDLESLTDMLQEHAPAYAYFGSHPGDGADYGFWLSESFEYDFEAFDGIKVADTDDIPRGYTGEVLQINDHGNMTLYHASISASLKK